MGNDKNKTTDDSKASIDYPGVPEDNSAIAADDSIASKAAYNGKFQFLNSMGASIVDGLVTHEVRNSSIDAHIDLAGLNNGAIKGPQSFTTHSGWTNDDLWRLHISLDTGEKFVIEHKQCNYTQADIGGVLTIEATRKGVNFKMPSSSSCTSGYD